MEILQVQTSEYRRYVPCQGLGEVEKALTAHSEDLDPDFKQKHPQLARIRRHLPAQIMGLVYQSGGNLQLNYGTDEEGSFFRHTVQVHRLNDLHDIYALGLVNSHVGIQPEINLAEYLEVPRTLIYADVHIQTQPVEDASFEFNLETILRKLDKTLGTGWASGEQAVAGMMTVDQYRAPQPNFILSQTKDLLISMRPQQVGFRFKSRFPGYCDPHPLDTWSTEGPILRGPLRELYQRSNPNHLPNLTITLQRPQPWQEATFPIWEAEQQARVLDLQSQIATALRS